MNLDSAAPRGGALLTLIGVVILWAMARVVLWEPPFEPASLSAKTADSVPTADQQPPEPAQAPWPAPSPSELPAGLAPHRIKRPWPEWRSAPLPDRVAPPQPYAPVAGTATGGAPFASTGLTAAHELVAHALLWQAGYKTPDTVPALYSQGPMSNAGGPPAPGFVPHTAEEVRSPPAPSRWSMDAWALWRDDSSSPLLTGRPSYGRSQLGAVLRYRLASESAYTPQLHLRASSALEGRREREVAAGVAVHPVLSVPIRLAAEARVSDTAFGTEVRAAAYAVTEIPPINLPAGFTAETYAQAGYVTGDFATPFIDGQARITRPLVEAGDFRLEAGGGAWGGAQEDARRFDIGPTAAIAFRIGNARGRVSADYRFRVAGAAEPSSGPALTLSAGF